MKRIAAPALSLVRRSSRRAASLVEFAMVGPIAILMLIGLTFGGLTTFRYVQMANVSRHAARWAAVHGKRHTDAVNGNPITAQDVYNNAIRPRLLSSRPQDFDYSVTWSPDGRIVTVSLAYTAPVEAMFVGGQIRSTSTMFVVR